jgi:hypothetical protein
VNKEYGKIYRGRKNYSTVLIDFINEIQNTLTDQETGDNLYKTGDIKISTDFKVKDLGALNYSSQIRKRLEDELKIAYRVKNPITSGDTFTQPLPAEAGRLAYRL